MAEQEDDEFGLAELARLPLLEQVHRLFHAIERKYPYTETNAWKTLPLEQKKRMLDYIRERRARKSEAPAVELATGQEHKPSAKTDPYLQMLQRRTLRSAPATSESADLLPNSAYVAPATVAEFAESAREAKKRFKARWKLAEAEFYEDECACGATHEQATGDKGTLLYTVSAMMSTFGDTDRSCVTTAEEVQHLVGEFIKRRLQTIESEELATGSCLRTLVEIFGEEAIYYGRWREFRGETKNEQNELEDVEEEELAEELDLFAVSEADSVFNEAFMERIRFADERTKSMDWSIYDLFAKGRKVNFMSKKAALFRQWIGIGKCSRASLEFLNFVVYHNIGRLVELAIKHRTGGQLKALETPLLKDDIEAVSSSFLPADPLPSLIDKPSSPSKSRRAGPQVVPNKSARTASAPHPISTPSPHESQPDTAEPSTESSEKPEAPQALSTPIAATRLATRSTRLKRLR